MINDATQYCRVKPSRQDYKGNRYFMYREFDDKVLQLVVKQGHKKKGRSNAIGIYQIGRVTFATSYQWNNAYLIPCTKEEFTNAMDKVFNKLKRTIK